MQAQVYPYSFIALALAACVHSDGPSTASDPVRQQEDEEPTTSPSAVDASASSKEEHQDDAGQLSQLSCDELQGIGHNTLWDRVSGLTECDAGRDCMSQCEVDSDCQRFFEWDGASCWAKCRGSGYLRGSARYERAVRAAFSGVVAEICQTIEARECTFAEPSCVPSGPFMPPEDVCEPAP